LASTAVFFGIKVRSAKSHTFLARRMFGESLSTRAFRPSASINRVVFHHRRAVEACVNCFLFVMGQYLLLIICCFVLLKCEEFMQRSSGGVIAGSLIAFI